MEILRIAPAGIFASVIILGGLVAVGARLVRSTGAVIVLAGGVLLLL
jgi:hypothetical protein